MTPGRAAFKGAAEIDGHRAYSASTPGGLTPQGRAREARRAFWLLLRRW